MGSIGESVCILLTAAKHRTETPFTSSRPRSSIATCWGLLMIADAYDVEIDD